MALDPDRTLDDYYDEIRQIYLADNRPWVLGYSGGKDSTCALQMVWIALSQLPVEQRSKPVYVISSDTLVETPVVAPVHRYDPCAHQDCRCRAELAVPDRESHARH